jgi:hypothetical protein
MSKLIAPSELAALSRRTSQIRDVCEGCNNGPLSTIDSYFCELYDEYFAHQIASTQRIDFRYDFGRLVRALLKISYNATRSTGKHEAQLRRYAPVMLTNDCCPAGVYVKLATISPSYVQNRQLGERQLLEARSRRSGPISLEGPDDPEIITRIIQINAFRFYLVVANSLKKHVLRPRGSSRELMVNAFRKSGGY